MAIFSYSVSGTTVSGFISSSGTFITPGYLVPGSSLVTLTYQYKLPTPSGNIGINVVDQLSYEDTFYSFSVSTASGTLELYSGAVGEGVGLTPLALGDGLIAYHSFDQGSVVDYSGNGYDGVEVGVVNTVIAKRGFGKQIAEFQQGYIDVPVLPTQLTDYMISFWFRPTTTLTSGTDNQFTLLSSDAFYGESFSVPWDYNVFQPYRGWYKLGTPIKCKTMYQDGIVWNYSQSVGASCANLFDDTTGTRYESGVSCASVPPWLYFYMENPEDYTRLTGFRLKAYNHTSYWALRHPKDVNIFYSFDKTTWVLTWTGTAPYPVGYNQWGSQVTLSGLPTAPYWALKVLNVYGASSYSVTIEEMEIYNTDTYTVSDYYVGSTLVLQGSNNSDWFDHTWTTAGLYFPILKTHSWEVETEVAANYLSVGQGFGIMFFNSLSYYDYASLVVVSKTSSTFDIEARTRSYKYTVAADLPQVSGICTFKLGLKKQDDFIYMKYQTYFDTSWVWSIYYMDVSLWDSSMRLGLKSFNAVGTAPKVNFHYFGFKRGVKPDELGDPEYPGRLLITYNEVDVLNNTQTRTDSRIWANTMRSGVSVGTSTYIWNSQQWYLLQFGYHQQTDEYTWFVNGKKERGLTIGSGINQGMLTGSMNYFDTEADSAMFILDEVAHWDRWLSLEESLKMINKTSQVKTFFTNSYYKTTVNSYIQDTTVTGAFSNTNVAAAHSFNWSTLYSRDYISSQTLEINKISYRIERQLRVCTNKPPTNIVNIIRCSSGWMSKYGGCWGCQTGEQQLPWVCQVTDTVPIYLESSLKPLFVFTTPAQVRTLQVNQQQLSVTESGVNVTHRQTVYDTTTPQLTESLPNPNDRCVPLRFDTYPSSQGSITVRDPGGNIFWDGVRVWIKHKKQGFHSYRYMDNFNFYELNFNNVNLEATTGSGVFSVVASGQGWKAVNTERSNHFIINDGFSSCAQLDRNTISGINYSVTQSGLAANLAVIEKASYHYDPIILVSGTRQLEITTTSGIWNKAAQTAPFMYFELPYYVNQWELQTLVEPTWVGKNNQQYAGLMLTDPLNPQWYYQLLCNPNGSITLNHEAPTQLLATISGSTSFTNKWWLKAQRNQNTINFYSSYDGDIWGSTPTFILGDLVPVFSGSNNYGSYFVFASYSDTTHYPWKAFNRTLVDANDCWYGPSSTTSGYLGVYLTQARMAYYYQLRPSIGANMETRGFPILQSWSLQGSNDYNNWTTIDYRSNQVDNGDYGWVPGPGVANYYKIQNPGWYSYYRIIFAKYQAKVSNFSLIGIVDSTITLPSGNLAVGPIVTADPIVTQSSVSLLPVMTGGNTKDGFTITSNVSNSSVYRLLDRITTMASGWTGTFVNPTWVTIQLPNTMLVTSYQLTYMNYDPSVSSSSYHGFPSSWTLQGSIDGVTYEVISTITNYRATYLNYQKGTSTNIIYIPHAKALQFYKLNITSVNSYSTIGLAELQLFGYTTAVSGTKCQPVKTYGAFNYVKLVTSSGGAGLEIEDEWELLQDGKYLNNSAANSGYGALTEIDPQAYQFSWTPKEEFESNETIYYRLQAADTPTFKISYEDHYTKLLWLTPSGISEDIVVTANLNSTRSGYNSISFDQGYYQLGCYPASGVINPSYSSAKTTTSGKLSNLAFSFNRHPIITDSFTLSNLTDFTLHSWLHPYRLTTISGYTITGSYDLLTLSNTETKSPLFSVSLSGSSMTCLANGVTAGNCSIIQPDYYQWSHIAIVKHQTYLRYFINGYSVNDFIEVPMSLNPSGSYFFTVGSGYYGLLDQLVLQTGALWEHNAFTSNYLDYVYTFRTVGKYELSVSLTAVPDTSSPQVLPKGPYPGASGVCPASGIVFDIVDDFSGVKWEQTDIQIAGWTVFSGGTNMTSFFSDRGLLSWDTLGAGGGEWEDIQLSPSGLAYIPGPNELLFPSGTVYSGSGAHGRRFTYYLPQPEQLNYFGNSLTITITGTDSVGYLSRFDGLYPNNFSYSYGFSFIPNTNICFGNIFMAPSESIKITEMAAKEIHFWVDLFDSAYPVTTISEVDSKLFWSDGYDTLLCSGTWFTSYSGNTGLIHRLHWDPQNDWDWQGHRAIQLTVLAQNTNTQCGVYNIKTYTFYYGWELNWFHQAVPGLYGPFEFNSKFPIFVSGKTYEFSPTRNSFSYMLWSAPACTSTLAVTLFAKPKPTTDLEVTLIAHSQYLQYSETVTVEVECCDFDGNIMTYSWSFITAPKPSS